jgi:ribonuclease HII
VDEAGRGPLFGRVYTAAVVLPNDDDFDFSRIKDSKRFTSKKKILAVCNYIKEHSLAYAITYEDEHTIDEINILQATIRSMHRSIRKLDIIPHHILIDGNYFKPYCHTEEINGDCIIRQIPNTCIKKGDDTYVSIAAASILAKCERDAYIQELCIAEPDLDIKYGLSTNKGYGTKRHCEGIREYGLSPYHRKSFSLK